MSEPRTVKARVTEDGHGNVFTVRCPNCGRDESVRRQGAVGCACGTILVFRADLAAPVVVPEPETIHVEMPAEPEVPAPVSTEGADEQ